MCNCSTEEAGEYRSLGFIMGLDGNEVRFLGFKPRQEELLRVGDSLLRFSISYVITKIIRNGVVSNPVWRWLTFPRQ